ncbi:MAG: hypothetical protein IK077_02220 [Thermoguttaceae bacterium]|nr:hypothetical protein [Thermoguttaceae bacterium]
MQYTIKGIYFTKQSNRIPISFGFGYQLQNLSPQSYTYNNYLSWGRFRVGLTYGWESIEYNGYLALKIKGYFAGSGTFPLCTGSPNLPPTLSRNLTAQKIGDDFIIDYDLGWQPQERIAVTWSHKNGEVYGQYSEGYNNYPPVSDVELSLDVGDSITYGDYHHHRVGIQVENVTTIQPYLQAVSWDSENNRVIENLLSTFQDGFEIQSESENLMEVVFRPALFQQHYVADFSSSPVASIILVTNRTQADIDAFQGYVPSDYLLTITDKIYERGETGDSYLSNVNYHCKLLATNLVLNTLS